jgi:hypothetical protein
MRPYYIGSVYQLVNNESPKTPKNNSNNNKFLGHKEHLAVISRKVLSEKTNLALFDYLALPKSKLVFSVAK